MTTQTDTIVETERPTRYSEPDDHEKFSHYVSKKALEAAILSGIPTRALCGKLWLPTRDPNQFPICPECKEIYEQIPLGDA